MTTVLLIVHLVITLALIGVVLIQRSEGGGLGVGTTQGMGSFMSGRGTANLLTRTTAILATAFMMLSLGLALLNRGTTVSSGRSSILDVAPRPAAQTVLPAPSPVAPAPAPVAPAPAAPAPAATAPVAPAVPDTAAPASPAPAATPSATPDAPAAPSR